jgi:hypothetical protein
MQKQNQRCQMADLPAKKHQFWPILRAPDLRNFFELI